WRSHSVSGVPRAWICPLADGLPVVRRARRRVGSPFLPLVSRPSARPQGGQRGGIGVTVFGGRGPLGPLQDALVETGPVEIDLAALQPIFRLQLLMVFFHHLVSYLFARSAQIRCEKERTAGRTAFAPRRVRLNFCRLDDAAGATLDRRREPHSPSHRSDRFHWRGLLHDDGHSIT